MAIIYHKNIIIKERSLLYNLKSDTVLWIWLKWLKGFIVVIAPEYKQKLIQNVSVFCHRTRTTFPSELQPVNRFLFWFRRNKNPNTQTKINVGTNLFVFYYLSDCLCSKATEGNFKTPTKLQICWDSGMQLKPTYAIF